MKVILSSVISGGRVEYISVVGSLASNMVVNGISVSDIGVVHTDVISSSVIFSIMISSVAVMINSVVSSWTSFVLSVVFVEVPPVVISVCTFVVDSFTVAVVVVSVVSFVD